MGTPPRHPRPRRALMVRVFGAGARGARRVADATGIEEAVEQTTEDAIVAALQSEAVERALLRVLEGPALVEALERAAASPRLERTVVEALDSELVDRVWERMLASDEAQKLVERIAEAPEVRAAVSQQGIGLLEDIGRQIRDFADRFDDVLEDLARRITRRHRRPEAADAKKRVGLVTRALAAAIDGGILNGGYIVISAIAGVTISEVVGDGGLSVASALVAAALWATASLIYLYFFWGLAGQTPGMRFLGIRIEAAGDPHLGRRRARRRLAGLLLALLPLGLGVLWILVSDDRRGWHDRIAGTEVVRVDPRPPPWSDSDSRSARA